MPLGPGTRLDGYEIVRLLGSGGMGEVWLATELRLGRKLAVKVLPADLTRDPARVQRLEQEARAAAALNHPNVCHIYALGATAENQHYIAMELVEGETLRQRLSTSRLSIQEALEIAVQIGTALSAAHSAGIIHRDVKPENVMLRSDGVVKVLDFGLAKLAPSAGDVIAGTTTRTMFRTERGVVVGTTAYMSPEQARGQEVDVRTDIWSLGVVLYELVGGRPPFEGTSSTDVLAAILEREPLPLARFAPEIPAELQRIVGRALRKNREHRYQSAKDMLLDLDDLRHEMTSRSRPTPFPDAPAARTGETTGSAEQAAPRQARVVARPVARVRPVVWRAAIGLLVCVLALGVLVSRGYLGPEPDAGRPAAPRPSIRSVAVLPLENLSRDPDQEYFADGMTEALIIRLSSVGGLRVISRPSVMQFKGRHTPVTEVAKALSVDAVVVGSVQRAGERVRISAQLVRGAMDETVWSDSFDRELDDVLALQSEVAHVIVQQIDRTISDAAADRGAPPMMRASPAPAPTVAPAVYENYLKGLHDLRQGTPTSVREAIAHFDNTIRLEAAFAPAHLGLAEAYSALGTLALSVGPATEMRQRALGAVRRALELDGELAPAHALLAGLQTDQYQWAEGEARYRRALALDPNLADAHAGLGWLLVCRRRFDEAVASSRRARELDPLSESPWVMLALTLNTAGRVDESIRELRGLVALNPDSVQGHAFLGFALLDTGQTKEAVRMNERAVVLSDRGPFWLGHLARSYARDGRHAEAEQLVHELRTLRKTQYVTPGAFVVAYAGLGNHDALLTALEEAYAERANIVKWLVVSQLYDEVRSHPRFLKLVRQVGLDDVAAGVQ